MLLGSHRVWHARQASERQKEQSGHLGEALPGLELVLGVTIPGHRGVVLPSVLVVLGLFALRGPQSPFSRTEQGTARRRGSTTDSARSDLTSTSSCALTSESNVRLWIQYVRKLRLARCVRGARRDAVRMRGCEMRTRDSLSVSVIVWNCDSRAIIAAGWLGMLAQAHSARSSGHHSPYLYYHHDCSNR